MCQTQSPESKIRGGVGNTSKTKLDRMDNLLNKKFTKLGLKIENNNLQDKTIKNLNMTENNTKTTKTRKHEYFTPTHEAYCKHPKNGCTQNFTA